MRGLILYISLFLFMAIPLPAQDDQIPIEVFGVLIDKAGSPIENARISWKYQSDDIDDQFGPRVSVLSTAEGLFGFVAEWRQADPIEVIVEPPFVVGKMCPIDVQSNQMRDRLSARIIKITEYSNEVDLGKVNFTVEYGLLRIILPQKDSEIVEKILNRNVYLSVADIDGNIFNRGSVNPAYSKKRNDLQICLPEGDWIVNLYSTSEVFLGRNRTRITIEPDSEIEIELKTAAKCNDLQLHWINPVVSTFPDSGQRRLCSARNPKDVAKY